jgi:ATP-binding cassette, subfamily B, bacterial
MPKIQREIFFVALNKQKTTLASFLAVTIISSLCTIGAPLIFSFGIKIIGDGTATPERLLSIFGAFAALIAGVRFLGDVRLVLMNSIEQNVKLESNKFSLAALLNATGTIFVANNPARIFDLIANLHQSNAIYIQTFLMVALAGTTDLLFSFIAIAGLVNGLTATFVVIYGIASVWLTLRANRATEFFQRQARKTSSEGANLLGNVVNNIVSVKIFCGQLWVQRLYENFSNGAKSSWAAYYRARLRYGAIQGVLIFIQYASILAMLAITLRSPELLNQIVLISMILVQLNRPFEMIADAIQEIGMAQVMAGMLQSEINQHARETTTKSDKKMPAPSKTLVQLTNVAFKYFPEDRPLLQNLSTIFKPDRLNFITGPSGVGKSSLLQILLGINEGYEGSVKVGDIDLKALDKDSYLSQIGYVSQEPMLMNLSIRDNVLFGRNYSDADVRAALVAVRLGEKTDGLADGLDYVIGERGQLLSGGERQRLAIARALVGKPCILILDEASSALDEETERSIFASLRAAAGRMTIIAVTHRLGVIDPNDSVLNLSFKKEAQINHPCA